MGFCAEPFASKVTERVVERTSLGVGSLLAKVHSTQWN